MAQTPRGPANGDGAQDAGGPNGAQKHVGVAPRLGGEQKVADDLPASPKAAIKDITKWTVRRRCLLRARTAIHNSLTALERRIYRDMTGKRAPKRQTRLSPEESRDLAMAACIAQREVPTAYGALKDLDGALRGFEAKICRAVHLLPVWSEWAALPEQRGIGELSVGVLIEGSRDGNPGLYRSKQAFWKHWGVGRHGDENQHRTTDKKKAKAMGYSPHRRALVHQISTTLLCTNGAGPYRSAYGDYKARKVTEYPAIVHVPGRAPISGKDLAHKQARRYMGKLALARFWQAWRRLMVPQSQTALALLAQYVDCRMAEG